MTIAEIPVFEDGLLDEATPQELDEIVRLAEIAAQVEWEDIARPEQLPPDWSWFVWLILAGRGWGKALALDTPISTPTGWTTMGDVQVGDELLDECGRVCRVTFATEVQHHRPCFRVRFDDGTSIVADGDHRWVTKTHRCRKSEGRRGPSYNTRRQRMEEAARLRAEGMKWAEIAERLGYSGEGAAHLAVKCLERWPDGDPRLVEGSTIRTTEEIRATLTHGKRGDLNHSIDLAAPLQLPTRVLPLDPYTLGAWLGDGNTRDGAVTVSDEDAGELLPALAYAPRREHRHLGSECATYPLGKLVREGSNLVGELTRDLIVLGVRNNKHIPAIYLRASEAQRLALLQGLMDTDGYADVGGVSEFYSMNPLLAGQVRELVVSLGWKARVRSKTARLEGRDCGLVFTVVFRSECCPFRLSRKVARWRPPGAQAARHRKRMITAVEPVQSVPVRCIRVDSPSHLFLAGRSMVPTHNTRTGAEWAVEKAREYPGCRIALVAQTFQDGRDTMVEGESGLLSVLERHELRGGDVDGAWNRSLGELFMANGSRFKIFSSEKPRQLRGPQHHFAWGDEPATWLDASKGPAEDTTWSNLAFGCRLSIDGSSPQITLTGTPKPVKLLIHKPVDDEGPPGLLHRESTALTRGHTDENLENLAEPYKREVVDPVRGTRLGRQELAAEILEDVEGALWKRDWIDANRVAERPRSPSGAVHEWQRTPRTGVDLSDGKDSGAKQAYTTSAMGMDHDLYVIASEEFAMRPYEFAREVIKHSARVGSIIVMEINHGGAWAEEVFKRAMIDLGMVRPLKVEHASEGKRTRAEPVAALYEPREFGSETLPGRVHHVGHFPRLEEQQTTFTGVGRESPDSLDSLVWSMWEFTGLSFKPPPSEFEDVAIPYTDKLTPAGAVPWA